MVTLFAAKIDHSISDTDYSKLMELVSPERRRTERFRNRGDALRGLIGEALIRWAISTEENIPNESIHFTTTPYGKPQLMGRSDIHFNVTHSDEWVIAALSQDEVGVDIERIGPLQMDIAANFFSPTEVEQLLELKEEERTNRFYELWTLKESYIKAVGKGLSISLDSFSIKLLIK